MDANEIKNELYRRGFNLNMLAEALSCSSSLVSKVISRKARSRRVALAIAKSINLDILDVFPELRQVRSTDRAQRESKLRELREILKQD